MTNEQEFIFGIYVGVMLAVIAGMLFVLCRYLYREWRLIQIRDVLRAVIEEIKKEGKL